MSKRDVLRRDDEMERLLCFVPDEGIDVEPLAAYLRQLLDPGIELKIGKNPHRPAQNGYFVTSAEAITMTDIRAIIEDTALYKRERETGSVKSYTASKAWIRRQEIGRASQNVKGNRPIAPVTSPSEKAAANPMASAARPGTNIQQQWQPQQQYGQRSSSGQSDYPQGYSDPRRSNTKPPTPHQQIYARETQITANFTSDYQQDPNFPDATMADRYDVAPPGYESTRPSGGGSQPPISAPGLSARDNKGYTSTAGPWSRHDKSRQYQ